MNYLKYVNIKQGSKSLHRFSQGNTLPLIQKPFGFAAFSLQTETSRGSWYYHPDDRCVEGIRLTRQPSPWISDHSAFTMMPQIEKPYVEFEDCWSGYDPDKAVLQPHYLKCYLKRPFCDFELTPTEYGACVRLSFKKDFDRYLSVLPVKFNCEYEFDKETNRLYCWTDCNRGKKSHDKGTLKGYYVFQFDEDSVDADKILTGNRNTCDTEHNLHTKGENTGIHIALKKKGCYFHRCYIIYKL